MPSEPDLSEFVKLSKANKKQCRVGVILETLDADAAEQLAAAIPASEPGGTITVGAIIEWCKQRGHEVSQNTIVYHRRGRCTCHEQS